jgi:hypothetical protein
MMVMKDTWLKKGLVISIIILFIGVAVAPSINISVVKASTDDDLVEVTTQACGIKGFGNTTVKLTREQYRNLEQYLVDFRARLNQTSTREEAIPIFKEAVVELNKYGLLPRGMTIEQALKLVIRKYPLQRTKQILQDVKNINNSNFFCLTVGYGNLNIRFHPLISSIGFLIYFIKSLLGSGDLLAVMLYIISEIYTNIIPLKFLSFIEFGQHYRVVGHPYQYPYQGHVSTIGLTGIKTWDGLQWGGIVTLSTFGFTTELIHHIGAIGFSGINIKTDQENMFFLGTSLWVKNNLD